MIRARVDTSLNSKAVTASSNSVEWTVEVVDGVDVYLLQGGQPSYLIITPKFSPSSSEKQVELDERKLMHLDAHRTKLRRYVRRLRLVL